MAHLPINHRLGGIYRALAGLAGLFLLLFGIIGASKTWGDKLFDRGTTEALGLRTNLAFSLLSIVVGAIVLVGSILGRNLDHYINFAGGAIFWLAGLVMLLLLQTKANILNFTVATSVVSFLVGTVLILAGMYGKRGTQEEAAAEEMFRHTGRGAATKVATPDHALSAHPGVKHRAT